MSDTPARLLSLLSLLQTPRQWPGSELAERLGVSLRTVRRDVDRLRDLGYPIDAAMGALGGYRLVAGAAMPPLLLDSTASGRNRMLPMPHTLAATDRARHPDPSDDLAAELSVLLDRVAIYRGIRGESPIEEYEWARELDEEMLARRRVLGDDHPETHRSARNLAADLTALGQSEQAAALLAEFGLAP